MPVLSAISMAIGARPVTAAYLRGSNLAQSYAALSLPSDFDWFPYAIYADNTTDYSPEDFRPAEGKTYYVKPAAQGGSNSNDGLSWETALASPSTAMQKSDCVIVMLAAGRYPKAVWGDITSQSNFRAMICDDGVAEFLASNLDDSANFVADESYPGTYKYSGTGTVYSVRDESILNTYGLPSRLAYASSAAVCAATPGSRYNDGTNLWVRLADDRVPDASVRVNTQRRAFIGLSGVDTYIKGIRWLGANVKIGGLYQTTARVHFVDCHAAYTTSGQGDAAFLSSLSGTTSFYSNCKAYGSELDCFSYQGGAKGVEVHCEAYDTPIAGSNNGSTMHGSSSAILINGYYHDSAGDVIASVSTAAVLCVGVISRNCLGSDAADWNSTSGPLYLVNCSNEGSVSDYSIQGGSAAYVQNNNFTLPNQSTTPTEYEFYTGDGVIPTLADWGAAA